MEPELGRRLVAASQNRLQFAVQGSLYGSSVEQPVSIGEDTTRMCKRAGLMENTHG